MLKKGRKGIAEAKWTHVVVRFNRALGFRYSIQILKYTDLFYRS